MRHVRTWEAWEAEVNAALGLSSTAGSGSQAHDPGDGTDRRHPSQTDYAIQADAKFTERASFSVNAKLLKQWSDRATAQGKNFVLPVRVWQKGLNGPDDYAVVPWQDYVALVESHRDGERAQREGDWA
jgi:hypothetical protein